MDFQVLGPLRAFRDGVDLELRGAKERTLLAHLVAYAGQVVPVASPIESLWGDDPPRSAVKSVHSYVLRVRNVLEPERGGNPRLLLTRGAGYQLRISASNHRCRPVLATCRARRPGACRRPTGGRGPGQP
jgi:DNA-binding SARP family transcriptional activator